MLIKKEVLDIPYRTAIAPLKEQLDELRGLLFSSAVEFPDRYNKYDLGLINPPLVINASGYEFSIEALNQRGNCILPVLYSHLVTFDLFSTLHATETAITGKIKIKNEYFPEEERTKQPSIFSLLRILLAFFKQKDDPYLGLYGAFGYDLAFQFNPIELTIPRNQKQRDLALYFPDEIYVVDHRLQKAEVHRYDFIFENTSTLGLARKGECKPFNPSSQITMKRNAEGKYADIVKEAKKYFKRGDLFEVVPSQSFYHAGEHCPSELFKYLIKTNPSPYSFFFNLGEEEYLVGVSPEMFVRVSGNFVETRPISGTIRRGQNALEDADNILTLLNSKKDEAELTMCTDVDRNDKARICVPGSVKVTARREIEKYSKLFHTVDHVEGTIAKGFDAIDAFLTHTWAVTVTGAPKRAAMHFIEKHEATPRNWYAGAIGWMTCNGNLNTGITLRTIQIKSGIAEVRVGATLLYDSNPIEEEKETELKAAALLQALNHKPMETEPKEIKPLHKTKLRVLLIDHEDSFVNVLADYLRQLGALVTTVRHHFPLELFDTLKPELVVLSPGPGIPEAFALHRTIELTLKRHIPLFGVCLGLQGIAEYFGASLKTLSVPVHGKKTAIEIKESRLLQGLPKICQVGRYHSLYVDPKEVPKDLLITALAEEEVVMAFEHKTLPIYAVQFHPESIMSQDNEVGINILKNLYRLIERSPVEIHHENLSSKFS